MVPGKREKKPNRRGKGKRGTREINKAKTPNWLDKIRV